MKLILSRKGFDSAAGGTASPIFADGTLCSLPIPDQKSIVTYHDLCWGEHNLGDVVEALTHGRVKRDTGAHLDPDLTATICPRLPGWQPLFGQDGAAQSHLANQGVGVGDLFLFFGWFRAVEQQNGLYRFRSATPDQHLIYGWLQVGQVLNHQHISQSLPAWTASHPHCLGGRGSRNTLYLAAEQLTLADVATSLPGAGILHSYQPKRCLTAPSASRTVWRLPRWFYPTEQQPPLTFHQDRARWWHDDHYAYVRSATRGQEFVLDTTAYPAAMAWVVDLLCAT